MVEFLETMPFWTWFVLAVALLIVEISTGTTYFLWPAAAAAVVGLADMSMLAGEWRLQLIIFAVITLVLTVFATPKVKPWLQNSRKDHLSLNERGEQKIGQRVVVETDFSSGRGKVRYGDSLWLAESVSGENFLAGAEVEITRVEGSKLVVTDV
jgi:membrane protein implicated in regulation of membrane protease activity